jgi:uncharacterized protein (DUF488 family)
MPDEPLAIWTVGHSNHPLDTLLDLLRTEQIEVLVDVRSAPYSRYAPHFNREALGPALEEAGLRYLYLGDALGGRPSRAEHYDAEGHALYSAMAEQPDFREAIARLLRGARSHRIALICAEADPTDCHRRLLVGRVLTQQGAELRHITPDRPPQVETEVKLSPSADQAKLFEVGRPEWRSTRSVSRSRAPSTSSAG